MWLANSAIFGGMQANTHSHSIESLSIIRLRRGAAALIAIHAVAIHCKSLSLPNAAAFYCFAFVGKPRMNAERHDFFELCQIGEVLRYGEYISGTLKQRNMFLSNRALPTLC